MLRTAAVLVLLASLSTAQFCPDFSQCSSCEAGWGKPDFTETDEYLGLDSCLITIRWNYPFTQEDDRANPRMVFLCSYDDGESCETQVNEDVCASCQEIVIGNIQNSRNPHITYSDTCGDIDTFPIGGGCHPSTGQETTTGPPTTSLTEETTAEVVTSVAPEETTAEVVTSVAPEETTDDGADIRCGVAYDIVGGRCLLIDPFITANWDEARFFCSQLGSELVLITTDELYLAIFDYIHERGLQDASYWIGGTDKLIDGTFTWLDSTPMELATPYWAVYGLGNGNYLQEPSNQGILNYDCVHMDGNRFLYYDDDDCSRVKAAICEHDPI